jgi:hypothetical protein
LTFQELTTPLDIRLLFLEASTQYTDGKKMQSRTEQELDWMFEHGMG